jgi:transcriptional regulator with XRE-family HTH domain
MPLTHMGVKHMCVTPWAEPLNPIRICVVDIKKALGRAIAYHRDARGLTQKDVPYDQGGLSKIENGIQGVSINKLAEVARAIGVPVSAIWDTADKLMRGESLKVAPAGLNALREKADASPMQSQYHLALAAVVEGVISTTPGIGNC